MYKETRVLRNEWGLPSVCTYIYIVYNAKHFNVYLLDVDRHPFDIFEYRWEGVSTWKFYKINLYLTIIQIKNKLNPMYIHIYIYILDLNHTFMPTWWYTLESN